MSGRGRCGLWSITVVNLGGEGSGGSIRTRSEVEVVKAVKIGECDIVGGGLRKTQT